MYLFCIQSFHCSLSESVNFLGIMKNICVKQLKFIFNNAYYKFFVCIARRSTLIFLFLHLFLLSKSVMKHRAIWQSDEDVTCFRREAFILSFFVFLRIS